MAPAVSQGSVTSALAVLALILALDNRVRLESAAPRQLLDDEPDEPLRARRRRTAALSYASTSHW